MQQLARLLVLSLGALLLCPHLKAQPSTNPSTLAFEALSRLKGIDLEKNPAVKSAVFKVLEQKRGTAGFVQIVRELRLKDQEEGLLEVVRTSPDFSAAADAMRLLLDANRPQLLENALSTTNAGAMILALGNTARKEIIPFLEPFVRNPQRDLSERKQAIESLARIEEGCHRLLQIASEAKFDLAGHIGRVLQATRWEDIRSAGSKLAAPQPGSSANEDLTIAQWALRHGDPGQGKQVFRRETVGCIKCHIVSGEGVDFGPALSEIGSKLGKDALYEAILNPSAGIAAGFEAWRIEMKDDSEVYGMIVSETSEELQVKSPGGIINHVTKSEIARRTQQKLSAMPAGLAQLMTSQDLVDLVEYLSTLKKPTP